MTPLTLAWVLWVLLHGGAPALSAGAYRLGTYGVLTTSGGIGLVVLGVPPADAAAALLILLGLTWHAAMVVAETTRDPTDTAVAGIAAYLLLGPAVATALAVPLLPP